MTALRMSEAIVREWVNQSVTEVMEDQGDDDEGIDDVGYAAWAQAARERGSFLLVNEISDQGERFWTFLVEWKSKEKWFLV